MSALLLALAVFLAACGGGSGQEPEETAPACRMSFYDPGLVCDELAGSCAGSGEEARCLFLLTILRDEDEIDHGYLYRVSPENGAEIVLATDQFLDGERGYIRPKAVQAGARGTLWLTVYGGAIGTDAYRDYLWQVDDSGKGLKTIDLTALAEKLELNRVDGAYVEENGWVYLLSGGRFYVFNERLTHRFTLEAGDLPGRSPVRLGDGRLGFLSPGEGEAGYRLRTVDRNGQRWGESYDLPEGSTRVFAGNEEYLFYAAGGVLYGWREGWEPLSDWLTAGIAPETVQSLAPLAEGRMHAVLYENGAPALAELAPAGEGELPEKTTLTIAGIGDNSYLRRLAAEFNRTSDTCRVVYKDYGSLTRLLADITAGNIPDILDTDGVPVKQLGAKGLLEDLWPYIENDPDLGREGVMEHVLECAEQDGALYYIFSKFNIDSAAGAVDVVGDRIGWTQEDFQSALASMPEGSAAFLMSDPKNDLLKTLLRADLDSFVDWETGTCSFDSQEFRDILAFCNEAKQEKGDLFDEYTMIPEGRVMLAEHGITNFMSIQRMEALFGRPVKFIGYPRRDGSCGSSFDISYNSTLLAMTAACREKEQAWALMRRILLPQGLDLSNVPFVNARFPVNREDFELLLEWSMKAEYD